MKRENNVQKPPTFVGARCVFVLQARNTKTLPRATHLALLERKGRALRSRTLVIQNPSKPQHMIAPRIANKVKTISFRIGETDFQNLQLLMERHNYKSLSKFVRDSIFRRRVGAKASPYSSDGIRAGILHFTQQLNKIGANYNQNVRRINYLSEKKRKSGDPVINNAILLNIEQQNARIMEQVQKTQDALVTLVNEALDKMDSRVAIIFLTSDDLVNSLYEATQISLQLDDAGAISLEQYIMTHNDAYTAFARLRDIIFQFDDLAREFENGTNNN